MSSDDVQKDTWIRAAFVLSGREECEGSVTLLLSTGEVSPALCTDVKSLLKKRF